MHICEFVSFSLQFCLGSFHLSLSIALIYLTRMSICVYLELEASTETCINDCETAWARILFGKLGENGNSFKETNKCSDRSMEVKLPALLRNYDQQTDRPTNQPTRCTDRQGHREVSLPIRKCKFSKGKF